MNHLFHMHSLRKSGSLCCACFGVLKKCLQKLLFYAFGSFGTFLKSLMTDIQKSPCQSLKNTSVTIIMFRVMFPHIERGSNSPMLLPQLCYHNDVIEF